MPDRFGLIKTLFILVNILRDDATPRLRDHGKDTA